jgi:hypothetical protein
MRVLALIAGLLLAVAGITVATEAGSKTDTGMCRVVCTPEPAAKPTHHARPRAAAAGHRANRHAVRHANHHHAHHYARRDYYSYREAEEVRSDEWHGRWHAAPNDARFPGPPPAGYYPPPAAPYCDCGEGLHVDQGGWTGGVGYAAAQEGGFMDGYGVMHFGSAGNGPTYNSYGQSFQYNPSMPRPFAPRAMGGFAPGRGMGGFGPHR